MVETPSENSEAARILAGFRITGMTMRDADTGEELWESREVWGPETLGAGAREVEAHVPARLLQCAAVSREITFASEAAIQNFRLVQNVLLAGTQVEQWVFNFGFVIPNSVNTWSQVIESADEMLPVEVLSGNVVIESLFYDGDQLVNKSYVRIFYDARGTQSL
jgi:retinal rod rhodopsin-sensitive cGMP 3',5'-cyclic phosphodiesterase subunit delta